MSPISPNRPQPPLPHLRAKSIAASAAPWPTALDAGRRTRLCRLAGSRWIRCRDGAAAVEFALIVFPLFALLVAILQIGVVFLAQQQLESAVEKSARALLTGQTQRGGLTEAQFAATICARLTALFDCSKVMFDVQTARDFPSADVSSPTLAYDANGNIANVWKYNPGAAGDVVVLRVFYQFPVIVGPLRFNLANLSNGKRLLIATAVFEAESYS